MLIAESVVSTSAIGCTAKMNFQLSSNFTFQSKIRRQRLDRIIPSKKGHTLINMYSNKIIIFIIFVIVFEILLSKGKTSLAYGWNQFIIRITYQNLALEFQLQVKARLSSDMGGVVLMSWNKICHEAANEKQLHWLEYKVSTLQSWYEITHFLQLLCRHWVCNPKIEGL